MEPADDEHRVDSALGEELLAADDAYRRLTQLTAELEQVEADTATWRTEVDMATAELEAETEDVDDLESITPTRMWASVTRSRERRLAKEKTERLEAATRLEIAHFNHDAGIDREQWLQEQIAALGDAGGRRALAMDAVQEVVLRSGGPTAVELRGVIDELDAIRVELDDLIAVRVTVDDAAAKLADAATWLMKAGDWATYDTFLGGGVIGDAIKYDRIDKAKWSLGMAETGLRTMSEALEGVGLTAVRGVEIGKLTGVFDVWFDNIVSDMAVRGRIREAADRVRDARATVADVQTELTGRRDRLAARVETLTAAREELLLASARR